MMSTLKHSFRASLCGAIIAALGTPAAASFTGNDLWEMCKQADQTSCRGYITGMIDGLVLGGATARVRITGEPLPGSVTGGAGEAVGVCLPPKGNMNQFIDVALAGLRDQPEKRHVGAAWFLYQVLGAAFPCDDKP